jgi:predicted regulator of Ras-like GTPase activity (Roadblock/LC7/MglB family)
MENAGGTSSVQAALCDLAASAVGVEAAVVVSLDGLPMASHGAPVDTDRLGALCGELVILARTIAQEFGRGDVDETWVRGDNGMALLLAAGNAAILAVLARGDARLGLLRLEARRAARSIARMV